MVLCWFPVIPTQVLTFFFAFLPHSLHGVAGVGTALSSLFTQQHADTSTLQDLLPIYKCELLATDSQETNNTMLISNQSYVIKFLIGTSLCFYRTVTEFKVHIYNKTDICRSFLFLLFAKVNCIQIYFQKHSLLDSNLISFRTCPELVFPQ